MVLNTLCWTNYFIFCFSHRLSVRLCFVALNFWFLQNLAQRWNFHRADAFDGETGMYKFTITTIYTIFALHQNVSVSHYQKCYCVNVLELRIAFEIYSLYRTYESLYLIGA